MHSHLFATASAASAFILAGHAIITLVSKRTGVRFTFKVSAKKGASQGPYFVSLLSGPENTRDYTYLGTIFTTDRVQVGGSTVYGPTYGTIPAKAPKYVHGMKSQVGADAPSARAFAWAWEKLAAGLLPETLEVWHEGRCGKCGRALTVPASIEAGIGPDCAEQMAKAA